MSMWRGWFIAVLFVFVWHGTVVSAAPLRPFLTASLEEILEHYHGQPLLLAFWSRECPPCIAELQLLSRMQRRHAFNLVLVSVDGYANSEATDSVLKEMRLQAVESWTFADEVPARLYYAIDPGWQGELPRSELFSPHGKRISHIGKLTADQINTWLRQGE